MRTTDQSAPRRGTGRLTERERLLCAHMARVRYLTREQIWRLTYPGCWESFVSQRMAVLEGLGLLRRTRAHGERLGFRSYEGRIVEVWALTLDGYRVALAVLGDVPKVPTQDVGAPYLAHATGLVELYLAMLGVGPERLGPKNRRGVKRAPNLSAKSPPVPLPTGWTWTAGETVRLPIANKVQHVTEPERLFVQPDAIIEFPGKRSRVFIEWETGTNPIASGKSASLFSKFQRYEDLFRGFADFSTSTTWYEDAFPDGWRPSVLLVLHSESRKQNATTGFADWCNQAAGRKAFAAPLFAFCTFDEARAMLGARPPATSGPANEGEERLRPGRVSVRGERLIAAARQYAGLLRILDEAHKTSTVPRAVPAEARHEYEVLRVYAERGRKALAAQGLAEAE